MPRKPNLAAALNQASGKPPKVDDSELISEAPSAEVSISPVKTKSTRPPSRQGKKAITGHFDPIVSKQLKRLALNRDTTVQDLLAEALNDLFTKHGENPIA